MTYTWVSIAVHIDIKQAKTGWVPVIKRDNEKLLTEWYNFVAQQYSPWLKVMVDFTIEEAMKDQRRKRGIAFLFL